MKQKTSFQLSAEALKTLREVSAKSGISQASILELLIRKAPALYIPQATKGDKK